MLIGAVSRVGGIRLANQFEQQLNRYTRQHGWNFSTSPSDLAQGPPALDDEALLTAYRSSVEYALSLARQILGERLLQSTLTDLTNSLTPQLCQIKDQYNLFHAHWPSKDSQAAKQPPPGRGIAASSRLGAASQ